MFKRKIYNNMVFFSVILWLKTFILQNDSIYPTQNINRIIKKKKIIEA